MANIITAFRIVCSIALLFFPAFSPAFFILYVFAGISDAADGAVARKTGTVSEFGSKLDTIADFIFVAVCLIKLLPVLKIEIPTYICIGIIAIIKLVNVIYGFAVQGRFASVHSVMNRITGVLLFVLPLTVGFIELRYSAAVVCATAAFAAIQEGYYIRKGRDGT